MHCKYLAHVLRWQTDSFQRPPTRCIASNLCICTALARLVSFQRLPGRCIASKSRCTANIRVYALRLQADSSQRLPTRCIARNLCTCTALARLVSFQRLPGRCIASKSRCTANIQIHALRWQAEFLQRLLPVVSQAIRVVALCWQDSLLSSGFLTAALHANRDALQIFKYMLCTGKLILPSGFLPDVAQARCVAALRWQD
jgi:hypothetical protein